MDTDLDVDERHIVVLGASGRVENVVAHQLLNAKLVIRAVARNTDK